MKRIIGIILTLLCCFSALLATGCDQKKGEQSNTIEIWAGGWQWSGSDLQNLKKYVQHFNDTNDLGLILDLKPKSDIDMSINTALSTGKVPDLILWDRLQTSTFVKEKFLIPVNELVERDKLDLGKYNAGSLTEMGYNGTVIGLPLDASMWGVFVNNKLVADYNNAGGRDEADKIVLSPDWTWDDLYTIANKLTKFNQGKMITAGYSKSNLNEFYSNFLYSTSPDASFIGSDGYSVYNTANSKAAIDFLKKTYNANICEIGMESKQSFVNGQLAMINQPTYFVSYLKETGKNLDYTFLPQPKFTGEEGLNAGYLGGYGLAMPNPEARFGRYPAQYTDKMLKAWSVMKWWAYDADNLSKWGETANTLPALKQVYSADNRPDYIKASPVLNVCADVADIQKIRPQIPGYLNILSNVFNIYLPQYFRSEIDMPTLLTEMKTKTDGIINQFK